MAINTKPLLPVIGWREWVSLPDLGVTSIKVKVDTGARSSSVHAINQRLFERDGEKWVRFQINPLQDSTANKVNVEAKVIDFRSVRSSSGVAEMRPVIATRIAILDQLWSIELTLSNRDAMGFRMLLGRQAFRKKFFVDAAGSYYGGKPQKKKLNKKNI